MKASKKGKDVSYCKLTKRIAYFYMIVMGILCTAPISKNDDAALEHTF